MPDKLRKKRNGSKWITVVVCFLFPCLLLTGGCGSRKEIVLTQDGGPGQESAAAMSEKVQLSQGAETTEAQQYADAKMTADEADCKVQEEIQESEEKHDTGEEKPSCVIHICGAVINPGVYELPAEGRICDAVEAAGGFLEEAAESALNLAARIEDGMQIMVPTEEEAEEWKAAGGNTMGGMAGAGAAYMSETGKAAESGLVNINRADKELLCTLPGIGENRAADIIAYREANGPFGKIEDIMNVNGIKEASFEKLKDKISVR